MIEALRQKREIGGDDPQLSGWFVLNAQSFEDAWVQVLHGGYSKCSLELRTGPVDGTGPGLLWDVKKNPHLTIDTVTLSFSRPAPAPAEPKQEAKKSFWPTDSFTRAIEASEFEERLSRLERAAAR